MAPPPRSYRIPRSPGSGGNPGQSFRVPHFLPEEEKLRFKRQSPTEAAPAVGELFSEL